MIAVSPPPRRPEAARARSSPRLLIGFVLLLLALVVAVVGFVRLINVLERGGYGSPEMRWVLLILGTAGAGLAAAIATLIWDVAKRYER